MTTLESRFTELHAENGRALLNYFRRRIAVEEDAADLVAETYLVLWRRIDCLPEEQEAARCWAFGVARGVLANYSRGVRRRLSLADKLRDDLRTVSSSATTECMEVDGVLEHLDAADRELLTLTCWDGLTLTQAATVLGINPSTARVRLHRARQRLQTFRGTEADRRADVSD
jgi:RNA polymerase sigma-70 factor, ECF subfamily